VGNRDGLFGLSHRSSPLFLLGEKQLQLMFLENRGFFCFVCRYAVAAVHVSF
jgi:hypothetical protein